MKTIIFGCGYLGRRLARACLPDSAARVVGVVRSEESAERLESEGIESLRVDLDGDSTVDIPFAGAQLFYFLPPSSDSQKETRISRLIDMMQQRQYPRRIVYLSTSGVYGDCHGAWIDETQRPAPEVPRALRRWRAESMLRAWCDAQQVELVTLRVAGFYGPERLPLERLRRGLPMVRASEAPFSNRIHIDDLVEVCRAAMQRGRAGGIYNVSDGNPTTMTDYFDCIADLSGLPRPPKISLADAESELSPGMHSYMRESRRLCNDRMLQELQVTLRYPTLAQGLPSCLGER